MYNLPVENLDDSQIQKSSLLGIFSNDDQKVLDQQLNTFKKPEYELLIKKITLILIGSAAGLLSPKAAEILSDAKFIKSIFLMNPDINRLKTILKYELDTRCLRSNDEKLRLNLMPYGELRNRYYDMKVELQEVKDKLTVFESKNKKSDHRDYNVQGNIDMDIINDTKEFMKKSIDRLEMFKNIKTIDSIEKFKTFDKFIKNPIPNINLARFNHNEYKDKIVDKRYNQETGRTYYKVENPVGIRFLDGDTGLVSNVTSFDSSTIYFRYSILDKNFTGIITPGVEDEYSIEDGDCMLLFNNKDLDLDDKDKMKKKHLVMLIIEENFSKQNLENNKNIKLAKFNHNEYKDKIVETRDLGNDNIGLHYSVENPVGMRFLDIDTGLVSTVIEWNPKMCYYRYSILNKDEDFVPFITPDPKYSFLIQDGDYMVMFNNENIELDEKGLPIEPDDEDRIKDKFLAILNSRN